MSEEAQPIGEITHYFNKISVAVLYLYDYIALGDWIHVYGSSTNFVQQIESMQYEHQPIEEAHAEDEIAIKVSERVRQGDKVYPYYPEEYN